MVNVNNMICHQKMVNEYLHTDMHCVHLNVLLFPNMLCNDCLFTKLNALYVCYIKFLGINATRILVTL